MDKSASTATKLPYRFKRIDEGIIPDPTIEIEVSTVKGWRKFDFLIDSGADTTCLPLQPYAELLGFKPNPEKKTKVGGDEGRGVTAYPGKIKVKITRKKKSS